jgi:hypothetical protein
VFRQLLSKDETRRFAMLDCHPRHLAVASHQINNAPVRDTGHGEPGDGLQSDWRNQWIP